MIDISIGDIVQRNTIDGYELLLVLREWKETSEEITYECLERWADGRYHVVSMTVWKNDSYRDLCVIGHMDLTNLKLLR